MNRILFIYRNQNLARKFIEHFQLNGFDIYTFYDEPVPYYEFSFWQRLENIFYRMVFKNTEQIHKINERNFQKLSNRCLKKLEKQGLEFNYCFVIRGDLVPENVLKYARSVSGKMIDYQLDGLSVSSKILNYDYLFDQIYVFDQSDVRQFPEYHLKAVTNCFFEDNQFLEKSVDFSYIGVNTGNRKKILENLYDHLHELSSDWIIKFYLKQDDFHRTKSGKIIFLDQPFDYPQTLELSNRSKVIIDIKREEHDGLSLRFFEAMNYQNKIITNNKSVKDYDFYDPDNIFVTDFEQFGGLEEFISKPYKEIDEQIKKHYNFKYWIRNVLQIP